MKICITAKENSLESEIDPRFGRGCFFVIWDSTSGEHEIIPNSFLDSSSGVGVQVAQFIASKGVSLVITGEVGPKAGRILEATNIKFTTGNSGTVKDVIDGYKL